MELLALVIINIVFGFVLYYIISIKLTNTMMNYQSQKLKKEIQAHTLQFFKESENYLSLMDSRISILKNLIQKAENLGIDFKEIQIREELEKIEAFQKRETKKQSIPKLEIPEEAPIVYQKTKITENPKMDETELAPSEGILASLGKAFKSIMGVSSSDLPELESPKPIPVSNKKHLDFSVGGNPFSESTQILDNAPTEDSFQGVFSNIQKSPVKQPKDKIKISIHAALQEIPEDTGKVDKVVFLLKKGYSHSEISEELGLAIPEISLIETIKLERNRRI